MPKPRSPVGAHMRASRPQGRNLGCAKARWTGVVGAGTGSYISVSSGLGHPSGTLQKPWLFGPAKATRGSGPS
eukprot:6152428-Alexandrium_andersonii.AAC.1